MTLPNERTRAVRNAREFLRNLLDPSKTPKVPKWIREEASHRLRHFPSDMDMDYAADGAPSTFAHIEKEPDFMSLIDLLPIEKLKKELKKSKKVTRNK